MYNKYPDIVDEFREYFGMPRLYPQRQRSETVATEKDVEAGRPSTPIKGSIDGNDGGGIRRVPTNVESPDSLDDSTLGDGRMELKYQQQRQNNIMSMSFASEDDYISNFMKHRKMNNRNMPSPSDKSGSMEESVYLDASYIGNDNQTASLDSPFSKAKFNAAYNADTDLDYSMDTMDNNFNKECFSSYARPNNATMTSTLDDTATYGENSHNNKCTVSLFSKYNDDTTLVSQLEEGEVDASPASSRIPEDASEGRTGVSSQSYSPLGRRNVTFSSQLLEDSCLNCSPEVVLKQCEDAIVAINNNAMAVINGSGNRNSNTNIPTEIQRQSSIRVKPQYTIVTKKSLMDSFTDDDSDSNGNKTNAKDLFGSNKQASAVENVVAAEVTPTFTVSTAGLWSPSSELDASSVATPSEGPSDESFSSQSRAVRIDVDGGLDMSTDDEEEQESPAAAHNVHVCKSAGCTACRHPQQNTPKFVPAKTISSAYESTLRPKVPPKRWWMDDTKLRQYVTSAMLPVSKFRSSISQGAAEEKPFDEP